MKEGETNSIYISLMEAEKLCSYSQEYLSLRARQGKLKATKNGHRNWVTTKNWLDEYLRVNQNNHNNNLDGTPIPVLIKEKQQTLSPIYNLFGPIRYNWAKSLGIGLVVFLLIVFLSFSVNTKALFSVNFTSPPRSPSATSEAVREIAGVETDRSNSSNIFKRVLLSIRNAFAPIPKNIIHDELAEKGYDDHHKMVHDHSSLVEGGTKIAPKEIDVTENINIGGSVNIGSSLQASSANIKELTINGKTFKQQVSSVIQQTDVNEMVINDLNVSGDLRVGNVIPLAHDQYGLGDLEHYFQKAYISTIEGGNLYLKYSLETGGNLTVGDNADIKAGLATTNVFPRENGVLDNKYDIGSASNRYQSGYFGTSLYAAGSSIVNNVVTLNSTGGTLNINAAGQTAIINSDAFDLNNTGAITIGTDGLERNITFEIANFNVNSTGTITLSGNTIITGTISQTLADNTADAFDLQEGTNNYINISTVNGSETIAFGNVTTNPSYSFLGIGSVTIAGSVEGTNALVVTAGDLRLVDGDLTVSSGELTVAGVGVHSITSSAGAITLTAGAASTWSTSSGLLSITGAGGITQTSTGGTLTINAAGQTFDLDAMTINIDGSTAINLGATADVPFDIDTSTLDIDSSGAITIDSTSTFSIDGVGASNVSTTAGDLTISTITSGTLSLTSAAATTINATAAALTLQTTTSGNIAINPASTSDIVMTLDTDGSILDINDTANTTTTAIDITSTTLTSGTALSIAQSTSAFIGKLLNLQASGGGAGTAYGLYSALTGAATTNIAGYFSATGATTNYGLIVENGLSGFGTATPSSTVHIVGQCVTGDTLLRRRRRRRKNLEFGTKNLEDNPGSDPSSNSESAPSSIAESDYIYDQVRIDQIKEGDEVLSLNEATGRFEYKKVRALMDMGKQKVYKLITESGKTIETTAEHPYLVASESQTKKNFDSNFLFDHFFNDLFTTAKEFYFKVLTKQEIKPIAFGGEKVNISRAGWQHLVHEKDRSRLNLISRFLALPKVVGLLNCEEVQPIYEKRGEVEFWAFQGAVDNVLTKVVVRSVKEGEKHFYSIMWKGEQKGIKEVIEVLANIEKEKGALSRLYPQCRGMVTPELQIQYNKFVESLSSGQKRAGDDKETFVKSAGEWKKVSELKEGQLIAVMGDNNEPIYEQIAKIEQLPAEKVFDIEIEDTHNFVGNDIVAHNTYINSSTATGTALDIDSNSLSTGTGLDVSSTSTAGGASGASYMLKSVRTGANANASHTAYGIYSDIQNTGTTSVNIGAYFSASGATTNLAVALANNEWLGSVDNAGTGYVNMMKINASDELEIGASIVSGTIEFAEDTGVATLVDMPVSSSSADGTEMSYTMRVDGNNIFKVYSLADGSGGVDTLRTYYYGSLIPSADNSHNLGSATEVFASGYFTNLLAGTGDVLTITANAASTWSTSSGLLSITGAGGITQTSTGGTLTINAAGQTFDLDAATVNIDGSTAINLGTTADVPFDIDTSTLDIDSSGAITIDTANQAITLDSGTGTMGFGTSNNAKTINLGTGTAIDTINIGTGSTGVDVISIGQAAASLALTDADWSITTAGILTTTGLANLNGGIAVDTDNFTVSGTTGAATIQSSATIGNLLAISSDTITTTGAYKGAYIDLTNVTPDATNLVYGLHINDQASTTTSTEYGLYIQGTNYDYGLYVEDDVYYGGAVTQAGNLTITKADPSIVLNVTTATDTDFWLGVQEDALGTDDDKFMIGDGTTPGTNPFLTIDTSGNVGIGTTGPGAKLDVQSSSVVIAQFVGSNATGSAIRVRDNGANNNPYIEFNDSGSAIGYIQASGGTELNVSVAGTNLFKIRTNSADRVTVNSTGNVGIGTTGPDRVLDALAASAPQLRLTQADGTVYADFQADSSGDLLLTMTGDEIKLADHLIFSTDNNYDIGASGATRPRTGYFGTSLIVAGANTLTGTQVSGSGAMTVNATSADLTLQTTTSGNIAINPASTSDIVMTLDTDSSNLQVTSVNTATDTIGIVADSQTTADVIDISANGLTTGTIFNLTSTSTAGGASGASYMINLARSGANAQLAHTAYGLYSNVTNTNVTSGTNIAAYLSASGATTANYGLVVENGLSGFGTATPSSTVHIVGQCVTGDTLLRRRRRRRKNLELGTGNLDDEDPSSVPNSKLQTPSSIAESDYIYDQVRIDQIQEGDEVLSLNEQTGKFEYKRVRALKEMGSKSIWKLTTASGKTIRTTAEHPYLTKIESSTTKEEQKPFFAFIDETGIFEQSKLNKMGVGALTMMGDHFVIGQKLHQIFVSTVEALKKIEERFEFKFKYITASSLPYYYKIINILEENLDLWQFDYLFEKRNDKDFWQHYLSLVEKLFQGKKNQFIVLADYLNQPRKADRTLADLEIGSIKKTLQLESQGTIFLQIADILLGSISFLENQRQDPYKEGVAKRVEKLLEKQKRAGVDSIYAAHNFNITNAKAFVKSAGEWKKVSELKEGQMVAVMGDNNEPIYEQIAKIEQLPAENVFDIEIEDTHNFVGNDIVAHNTYINSSTATGTALDIDANSLTSGTGLDVSSTSTAGGASGSSTLLNLSRSGANAQLAHTAYGLYSNVTNTNVTSGTNIAAYLSASGATTANYGLIVAAGNVGFGDTTPGAQLEVGNGTDSLQVSTVGDLTFVDADGAASITGPAGGALTVAAGASQALTLTANAASVWSSSSGGLTINATSADLAFTTTTSGNITATTALGTGILNILTGNFKVGNGTPGVSLDGEDAYIEGTLEVDGAATFDSTIASAGNLTITKADPSIVLNVTTATDTDFWLGVQENALGTDDDKFQIGDGTTPGTNPFLTIDTSGNVGIGTTGPGAKLEVNGNILLSKGGARTISVDTATSGTGNNLTIQAGTGAENQSGGLLTISGGSAGATYGHGGSVTIQGGARTGAGQSGNISLSALEGSVPGNISLTTANSTVGWGTGNISLSIGTSYSAASTAGSITLQAGNMNHISNPSTAGSISLIAGVTTSGAGTHGPITFKTGNNEVVRISGSGNLGIGTTSPTGLLDVNNGTTQTITASANARIVNIQGALTEAASGVHARIAGVEITPPTITAGVATVTDTASLYISAAPTATVTGANYALWSDAGTNRFDGDAIIGGSTSATETLANTGFVMGGDDLFVAGMMGIEGSVYTDGSFIAGSTTTYGDGSILGSAALSVSATSADLTLQTTTSGNIAINPASTSDIVMTLDTDGSNLQVTSVNTATDTIGIVADSQTTADVIDISADGLTTGTIFNLTSTSTAGGASGASYMIKSVRTGANANASHTAYGIYSDIQNTGTTSINIGAYFSASGATTNLAVALANNEWLGSVDNAGTGYINMMKINASDELEIGAPIVSGTIEFAEDTGVATLVDMPVSSSSADGTEMSYTMRVDGNNILRVRGEADGAGGADNFRAEVTGRIRMSTWTADGDTLVYKDDTTGDIGIVTSDIRLKKNIVPIDSALEKIGRLQGFLYNSLEEEDGAKKRLGLSAQDVMAVLPEATFSFTNEAGEEYYSVHYEKLTALLVEGIKQQQGEIEDLNQSIAELELQAGESTFENLTVSGKAEIGELEVGKIAADNIEVVELVTAKNLKVTENVEIGGILKVKTIEVSESLKIGSTENYAQFDKDGLLSFAGKARPVRTIALAPEYPNALIRDGGAEDIGELTIDYNAAENHSFYNWTSAEKTSQFREIVIRVRLPKNFSGWTEENPIAFQVWSDDTEKTILAASLRDSDGAVDPSVNSLIVNPKENFVWETQNGKPSGVYRGDSWITLTIQMAASNKSNVRIGEIVMDYLSNN